MADWKKKIRSKLGEESSSAKSLPQDTIKEVADIPDDFQLISDSQEIQEILNHLGKKDADYDFLFVKENQGDYVAVYGGYGIPYLNKPVYKLAFKPSKKANKKVAEEEKIADILDIAWNSEGTHAVVIADNEAMYEFVDSYTNYDNIKEYFDVVKRCFEDPKERKKYFKPYHGELVV